MMSAKDAVFRLLETLPDDAYIEDIQYHLYVLQKVRAGEEAVSAGKVILHEEVMRELAEPMRLPTRGPSHSG
ncbi:MAG: hypothetical protein AUH81_11995 [Candidatus Rokubacteria bacterium 13_1_40CM_4_69_5]|nr:MAG: hypothetical protein AUH81_11995 [Candidatus Rokubacteria bacterium 13_1_40CM_4_69_5]